jgi:hypothetical protein
MGKEGGREVGFASDGDGEIIMGWTAAALALTLALVFEGDGGPTGGCESGGTVCIGESRDAYTCECGCARSSSSGSGSGNGSGNGNGGVAVGVAAEPEPEPEGNGSGEVVSMSA